jgi:nitrogen fixation protein FixH
MQKYYAIDLSEQDGPMRAEVYKASEVDAVLKRQAGAAIAGMNAANRESSPEALESERSANAVLTAENERLRAALTVSRGQWIHSVNAKQCLDALGEPALDVSDEQRYKAHGHWVPV